MQGERGSQSRTRLRGVGNFQGLAVFFAKGAGVDHWGRSANRRRAKVTRKFDLKGAFRRLMDQFDEPLGVSSNENPTIDRLSRVEN